MEQAIRAWLRGDGPRPIFHRRCAGIAIHPGCSARIEHPLPHIDDVKVEHRLDSLVPDVTLYKNGEAVAAIEIFATHRVDSQKRDRLRVPWVELDADEVVLLGTQWLPVQDFLRALQCSECERKAADYARRYKDGYLRGETRCFRCSKETVVYKWGGQWNEDTPREPRPPSIKYRFSSTLGRKYWVNTCGHCGAMQGDWFLNNRPDGPFFGTHVVALAEVRYRKTLGWTTYLRERVIAELKQRAEQARGDQPERVQFPSAS